MDEGQLLSITYRNKACFNTEIYPNKILHNNFCIGFLKNGCVIFKSVPLRVDVIYGVSKLLYWIKDPMLYYLYLPGIL